MYALSAQLLSSIMAATSLPASSYASLSPVGDAALAEVRGGAATERWVRDLSDEQADVQAQAVAVTMRVGTENWFADVNVLRIDNAIIVAGQ